MRSYTIDEFAEILGITKITLCDLIRKGLIIPNRTEKGEAYFTDESLAILFVKYIIRPEYRNKSSLYVICESDEIKVNNLIDYCKKVENSMHINTVFLKDCINLFYELYGNNEIELKLHQDFILKELSWSLKNYVSKMFLEIFHASNKYKTDFNYFDLESLILNDINNISDDLIKKFNDLGKQVKNNIIIGDNDFNTNTQTMSYELLKLCLENKLKCFITAKELSIREKYIVNRVNIRELVSLYDIVDDYNYCRLNKFSQYIKIEDILKLAEYGYYHIFKFKKTEQCNYILSNYLESNIFKNVYVLGSERDMLSEELLLKCETYDQEALVLYDILNFICKN